MEPRPIPEKYLVQGIGYPMHFVGPPGSNVGDLQILVLPDPAQMRAVLLNQPPPMPPGSTDLWISWWEPNTLERHQIANGAPVRLTFIGTTGVPPMRMEVGAGLEGATHDSTETN